MKGNISVQTENIFPIIKKFLYSDQEIFLRELIANAIDATSKIKTLSARSEFKGELGDLKIEILLDEAAKTLTVRDKGIGLTAEEAKKYLSEVAFSSAAEFLEKYKGEVNIIGHFGLGFYSAFMVAQKVEVFSKSWKDEPAVKWTCEGQTEYDIEEIQKEGRGTDIVLHIADDALEYLEKSKIQELLDKYCRFLPVEIQFGTSTVSEDEGEGDDKKSVQKEVPNIINDTNPIWKKSPSELTDENYKAFYEKLFPFSQEPSFWVHLNIDYPFNLTGVLYFPKMSRNIEPQRNKISLYCNQVYVTDDVRDIVPEFLTLLHGVIDSPDIPLNVSRSSLQSDRNVKQITQYITKKVADKLEEMYKKDCESYEKNWEGIGVFVKYGMITEDKFAERAKKFCLLESTEGQFFNFEEYREKIQTLQTDKNEKVVHLYANDIIEQDSYIQSAKKIGYDVLLFNNVLDSHFMQKMEHDLEKVSFVRVDADTPDKLIAKDENRESVLSEADKTKVKDLFQAEIKDQFARIELSPLSPDDQPVVITKPEFMRRMKEMQMLQGMGDFPDSYNVVVNTNHPIFSDKLLKMRKEEKKAELVKHLYDLARLHQNMLKGQDLTNFIQKSVSLMGGE